MRRRTGVAVFSVVGLAALAALFMESRFKGRSRPTRSSSALVPESYQPGATGAAFYVDKILNDTGNHM